MGTFMKVITFLNFLLYFLLIISCQNESKIHTDYIYLTDNMKLYQYLKDTCSILIDVN